MRLQLIGEIQHLIQGCRYLADELGISIIEQDKGDISADKVYVYAVQGDLEVIKEGEGTYIIKYEKAHHFFRALGILVEHSQQSTFHIVEHPRFERMGPMVDVSRNAVMKVETIQQFLRKMALMGLNQFALYMEDTFTIEERPYFGYKRGRYSYDELKACDDYAHALGIEIFPCIQTLAHLGEVLKWDWTQSIKDTPKNLLVGEAKTYAFVEQMIVAATKPFRSNRINIGMDEAHLLGTGKYLENNGYHTRTHIMRRHLKAVMDIVQKHKLCASMWSDMFFRALTDTENHYVLDKEVSQEIVESKPKDIRLVYWDYYHHNQEFYEQCIDRHMAFGEVPIFAGGVWTWNGPAVNYNKVFLTANAYMEACKKKKVQEVLITAWGDDGNEANIFGTLLGMQLHSEHGYTDTVDTEHLKRRFEACVGESFDAFLAMGQFDGTPGTDYTASHTSVYNPSKYILWQELLGGLFDCHVQGLDLPKHYEQLKETLEKHTTKSQYPLLMEFYKNLAEVLSIKAELGIHISKAYKAKDMKGLRKMIDRELPDLREAIERLNVSHRELWYSTYKAFGFEVLDIRYGGLKQRVDTTIYRLEGFIEGRITALEEIEEESLIFDGGEKEPGVELINFNQYLRIASAGVMGF